MVIHQEKITETERVAQAFAKRLFEREGYRITKGKRGCDFIARKRSEAIPVEVKGRTKLMNFTNMSKHQLETLQSVPNARVIFVYIDAKDKPQVMTHFSLTKDDIAQFAVSSYRVKWKGSIQDRVMAALSRDIQQNRDLINQLKVDKNLVGTGS